MKNSWCKSFWGKKKTPKPNKYTFSDLVNRVNRLLIEESLAAEKGGFWVSEKELVSTSGTY